MIDKQYCYRLLFEEQQNGTNCEQYIKDLALSVSIPKNVIRFLNDVRKPEVTKFFEDLRERNKKRTHKLYGTLMSDTEDVCKLSKALSSYVTQALIFTETMPEMQKKEVFQQLRLTEAIEALNSYFTNNDIKLILNVCRSISSDIKLLECRES